MPLKIHVDPAAEVLDCSEDMCGSECDGDDDVSELEEEEATKLLFPEGADPDRR